MRRASVLAFAGLLVLLLAAAVATLTWGRLGLDPADLPAALLGDAQGKDRFVFNRLRGPRLTVAIGVGAALGLSGALFQSVTRNPLGSPDVIGLSAGAGAGAAICALMFPGTVPVALGALIGAVAAMALVYVSTGTGFRNPPGSSSPVSGSPRWAPLSRSTSSTPWSATRPPSSPRTSTAASPPAPGPTPPPSGWSCWPSPR